MTSSNTRLRPGVLAALGAAALFGASAPLATLLLANVDPWMLAGLFYLGSGAGLWLYRWIARLKPVAMPPGDWPWLIGAIASGGVLGPLLLMYGLSHMPAASASLLLNAESVFTALVAWIVFRENVNRRVGLGMLAIVAGASWLSWPAQADFGQAWPALAVLGACLAWGVDNNLTRRVALNDATWIAAIKGLVAGSVNLLMAVLLVGAPWPAPEHVLGAAAVGFVAYGVSLALFVLALRHLGAARTGAYFSVAPFFGAVLSLPLLGESITAPMLIAGLLMGLGVWLHLSEQHRHLHPHEALEHTHAHVHDAHHQHSHGEGVDAAQPHLHLHRHEALTHSHEHFPDAHHRHPH